MQSNRSPGLRTAVLAALMAASAACAAQAQPQPQPQPLQPSPPAVAGSALPPAPPAAAPGPLADAAPPVAVAVATQATVARFLTNPDGDVDGFMTDAGVLVRVPPHLGAQLTATVRKGDRVQVIGARDEAGNVAAQRIADTRSGRQWIDQPPLPGARPLPRAAGSEGLARLSAQGQVAHVTTAPRGEADGVILADGTVVKLSPLAAQQFATLVRPGATVAAQGYGTRNQYGTSLQATAFGPPGNLTPLYERNPPNP